MKIKSLDNSLTVKLKLERSEGTRHTDYRLICDGRKVALPALIRVSHGSGELASNNVGGVAKALGLNEHGLNEVVKCPIGRGCVLLCLSVRLLDFVAQQMRDQGEVFRPGMMAMLESVELLLKEPDLRDAPPWKSAEKKALRRAAEAAERLAAVKGLEKMVAKLLSHMGEV